MEKKAKIKQVSREVMRYPRSARRVYNIAWEKTALEIVHQLGEGRTGMENRNAMVYWFVDGKKRFSVK